ncbi:MAG: ABC transporter substrate-binding protein [bacterium]
MKSSLLICRGLPCVVVIAASLLFSGDASAMGKVNETESDRVVVEYWEKWTGFEGDAMQAVVDAFNASQDRIFVKKLTVSTIDQKMMLSTAGGNPPDVAGLWSFNVSVYSQKNALTPLNRMLEEKGITRDRYIPIFWDLCSHNGFVWALPSTPATIALHWNKKMFRDAGLDPEKPPRSIAELDAMAERLTIVRVTRNGTPARVRYTDLTEEEKADPDENFELIQLGYTPSEPGWWNHSWCYWFGGRHWDGDRTITALDPGMVAAFQWFGSYSKKYGIANLRSLGSSFGNFSSPQNAFLAGKVAMVIQGVWMYNFIEKYNPELEWGAAPFPSSDPGRWPLVTLAECDILVIPRGARHPREAFEFMAYVNSQEAMELLNMGQRKFSPLAQISPEFVKNHPNPYIDVFIALARSPDVQTVPPLPIWNEYADEVVIAADQIFSGRKTVEDALGVVQGRVQRKLDRVMRRWDRVKDERIKEWSAYDPW